MENEGLFTNMQEHRHIGGLCLQGFPWLLPSRLQFRPIKL
ncbi:hypothetical protein AVEN_38557-1, partial [Araneus ventricosus]